jgi:DNA (cytosine-5)-methyltransferase 1
MKGEINIADLFCGAGGTSTGAVEAAEMLGLKARLTAINHWEVAVATHRMNHPRARRRCASLDNINPRDLFREGELDLLWASPECTHHSVAAGGRPRNEQSRATAWCVVRWAEALRPPIILVENVPEFKTWGPIGAKGRPLASQRGRTFLAWVGALESLGYRVGWRILCAADYGDPTTRRRLFIQAVRGRRRICWPEPTHAEGGDVDLLGARKPWVAAREIIDWTIQGRSIFRRKKPLAEKTRRRIFAGLEKFGPGGGFLIKLRGGSAAHIAASAHAIDEPLDTVSTGGNHALAQPFLIHVAHSGERPAMPVDAAMPTITCSNDFALCEPALLPQQSRGALRPVSRPAPTVATAGAIGLVEPFLGEFYGNGGTRSCEKPLGTVTTHDRCGLAMPEVMVEGKRYLLDVRFRMLQPGELAAAQGFRGDYKFAGNRTEQVRQIGNAVPRTLARALVLAALSGRGDGA